MMCNYMMTNAILSPPQQQGNDVSLPLEMCSTCTYLNGLNNSIIQCSEIAIDAIIESND